MFPQAFGLLGLIQTVTLSLFSLHSLLTPVAYRGRGWGLGVFNPPPSKFRSPFKIVANSPRLWKLLKIVEFRRPTPQDVRKKGSKIRKLPPVRNCFTLAKTNKLVVIINNLKVPKMKKSLPNEMKCHVPNYSCLQNSWLGGYRPQIPVLSVLCHQLNLLNPLRTKFLGTPLSDAIVHSGQTHVRICLCCVEFYH